MQAYKYSFSMLFFAVTLVGNVVLDRPVLADDTDAPADAPTDDTDTPTDTPATADAPTDEPTDAPVDTPADAPTDANPVTPAPAAAGTFGGTDVGDLDLASLLSTDLTVVSATKMKQTIAESPSVIAVITRSDFDKRGFRSVAEALSSIPGLYVNYDYVFYDVGVRGISGDMRGNSRLIKVLIDGRPISFRSDTTNFLGPEMMPLDIIDRVEVIRGPGSALYGANAFLGVVNVVTKSGKAFNGFRISIGGESTPITVPDANAPEGTSVNINPGNQLTATYGNKIGALDFLFSYQQGHSDRSGVRLPCGTTYAGAKNVVDPCAEQRADAQDPTIFDIVTDDVHSNPRSFYTSASLDLGEAWGEDPGRYGVIRFNGNLQEISADAPFTDWGLLQYSYQRDAQGNQLGVVENSGNHLGLYNGGAGLSYGVSLWEDLVSVNVNAAYATGGINHETERLRDQSLTDSNGNPKNRDSYGFNGYDLSADVRWTLLEQFIPMGAGAESIIDNLTLIASSDMTRDTVNYSENAFAQPISYISSDLDNIGALGQLTGSFFGKRLGFIAGARYDMHRGAQLTEIQLARLTDPSKLCEGRVCYDSFNYRVGGTLLLLKDVGGRFGRGAVVDSLYTKVLYGTAFKAPDASFLYNDEYLGQLPVRPNAELRPQNVQSFEVLLGTELLEKRLKAQVVYYNNAIQDQVVFQRVSGGVTARNSVAAATNGVEADFSFNWEPVSVGGQVSAQASQRIFEDEFSQAIPETFAFPNVTGGVWATVDVPYIESYVTLSGRYVGERVGSPLNGRGDNINTKYQLPAYALFDLDIRSHDFNVLGKDSPTNVSISVRNLLDQPYQFSGFQPFYGTDLPGLPRTIFAKVEQKF